MDIFRRINSVIFVFSLLSMLPCEIACSVLDVYVFSSWLDCSYISPSQHISCGQARGQVVRLNLLETIFTTVGTRSNLLLDKVHELFRVASRDRRYETWKNK